MCREVDKGSVNKTYGIAGYVIESFIPSEYLRGNFVEYEISKSDKVLPDVMVRLVYEDVNCKTVGKQIAENKIFYCFNNVYTYQYTNYKYISYSRLVMDNNMNTIIIYSTKDKIELDELFNYKTEVSYAFRDVFYSFLIEKNNLCLHSAGYIKNKKGFLISGHSGSGKSTRIRNIKDKIIVGEDVNVCKIVNGKMIFGALPWCRINNNVWGELSQIVFLGNKEKTMSIDEIKNELSKNEFVMSWLPNSGNVVDYYSDILFKLGCVMELAYSI